MSCSRIQQELHTHTDRFGVRRSTPHRPLSNVVSGVLKLSIEKKYIVFQIKSIVYISVCYLFTSEKPELFL